MIFIKDFNLNLLPASLSINTDYTREFNRQKFRDTDLNQDNIGIQELFRRNYLFDFQLALNYPITENLMINYNLSNNHIVRNYFLNDQIDGIQNPELDIWDRFFDFGDPNRQSQQIAINYELPLNKIPTLNFLRTSYSYTGDYQWQKGSDLFYFIFYVSIFMIIFPRFFSQIINIFRYLFDGGISFVSSVLYTNV